VAESWEPLLTRWIDAGLIDVDAGARVCAFEMERAGSAQLRWPIWIALAFGALMLGAGVLLFVSAHWDVLSPETRLVLVLLLVTTFHVGGASIASRFPALADALHAVGTLALGAGIFLAGQIFNLDEHWPGGVMLWALGAVIGWIVRKDLPQLTLVAILVPAWLASEWIAAVEPSLPFAGMAADVLLCGQFLVALAYFTAVRGAVEDPRRRVLLWLGGMWLVPACLSLALYDAPFLGRSQLASLPWDLLASGWIIAVGAPLTLSLLLRGGAAWPNGVSAVWAVIEIGLHASRYDGVLLYVWWALGAVGLVASGIRDARAERINVGAAVFSATVLAFYFSEVFDKVGRSASLVGLGALFLVGGWLLERARRHFVLQIGGRIA
jgi:uncharacterized membrane protein